MTTDQAPTTWTQQDLDVDDIHNTLLEGFDQYNDVNGPHWESIARKVYLAHVKPALALAAAIEGTRKVVGGERDALRSELSTLESLVRQATDRANRQAREIDSLRGELDHFRIHSNGNGHGGG